VISWSQGVHVALGMASLKDLPAEVLEKILGLLSGDSVSVRRAGLVCYQWADIIQNLLLRCRISCSPKVLRRLTTTESFNEAFTIIEESRPHAFKEGSLLAARAEKVFLTHMEIIRVKYPNSLHRLHKEAALSSRQPAFQLDMVVDRPILLLGIAVFLPHGENIQGDVSIFVGASVKVCDETSEETTRERRVEVSRNQMLSHSSMCIDRTNGQKKVDKECYPPPGHLYQHRKAKRHCLGLHPLPVMFSLPLEVPKKTVCRLKLLMEYKDGGTVETVWGGGGQEKLNSGKSSFHFIRVIGEDVRSSVTSGQIPLLYYLD